MRIALALLVLLGSLSVSASVFDDTKALAGQGDADVRGLQKSTYQKAVCWEE